ncbi:MAG: DEAD/DEAH box helicase [Beijerinckiaceae bacterium]
MSAHDAARLESQRGERPIPAGKDMILTNPNTNGFAAFPLAAPIAAALKAAGFTTPTPIQAQAIPPLLDGRDIIGIAQTGTGKTAAFALPMLHAFSLNPKKAEPKTARMVVLSPTRELALQIADTFRTLGKGLRFSLATIFGGVGERPQIDAAARGIDILVATPGRLMDLIERRFISLGKTEVFVLDEADRMLDMGFVRDVKRLVKLLPTKRHSLMFSATMPPAIREIAAEMLRDPAHVTVTPKVVTVERIAQTVIHTPAREKRALLLDLLKDPDLDKVVVFCRTKHGANKVAQFLEKAGVSASAIHGNKSQGARQAALAGFRDGGVRVLVATDIMARGIDVPDISHVINYELPEVAESYVHRIGRTARAGREGIAISFCDAAERPLLKQIERLTKVALTERTHALSAEALAAVPAAAEQRGPRQPQARGGHAQDRQPNRGQNRPKHRDQQGRPQQGQARDHQARGQQAQPQQQQQKPRPQGLGQSRAPSDARQGGGSSWKRRGRR